MATIMANKLAAAQSAAAIKAVPVTPTARTQVARSIVGAVDRLAIAGPAHSFEVRRPLMLRQTGADTCPHA